MWEDPMRAIEAKSFSGYGGLRQTEFPTPQRAKDRVLIRVTAAGIVHCVDRSSEPSRVIILRRRSSGKGTAVFVLLMYQMHVA